MRRCTKRSGRAVSSAPAAERCSLRKPEDALARLGRQLRRLGRRHQRADHVELAPARDLHAARDVDRAQLDRRAGQGAHDGAGVAGIDEQPQPGEHVLDLGALEEGGRAGQAVGHRALLQGDGDRLALVAHRAHEHRRSRRAPPPSARAARSPPPRPGPGRARWRSARSARCRPAGRRPPSRCGPRSAPRRPAPPCRIGGRRAQRALQAHGVRARAARSARSRRFPGAAPRPRRTAQSSSPAAVSPPCSLPSATTRRRPASSRSWASSTSTWRQRAQTRARTWGLSCRRATARRSRSPKSSAPCSRSIRSWVS